MRPVDGGTTTAADDAGLPAWAVLPDAETSDTTAGGDVCPWTDGDAIVDCTPASTAECGDIAALVEAVWWACSVVADATADSADEPDGDVWLNAEALVAATAAVEPNGN